MIEGESSPNTDSPFPRLQVFLDLDDCLVNTELVGSFENIEETWNKLGFESFTFSLPGTYPSHYGVVMRPGLRQFLSEANAIADLFIFTDATEEYAAKIVQNLDPSSTLIQRVWSRESVRSMGRGNTKDLTKLEGIIFNPKRGILIDNNSYNMVYQPHNGILSQSSTRMSCGIRFKRTCSTPKPEENPLQDILAELHSMTHLEDIRPYLRDKYHIAELIKATCDDFRLPSGSAAAWESEYCVIEE